MTSETSPGWTLARLRAALIAISPSFEAGKEASAPLNEPTGVRAALAITIVEESSLIGDPSLGIVLSNLSNVSRDAGRF
jgi:hypothetical protein